MGTKIRKKKNKTKEKEQQYNVLCNTLLNLA